MLGAKTTNQREPRFASGRLEVGCAALALALGCVIAVAILVSGSFAVKQDNVFAFLDSTLLGPLLGLGGAWLDARRGNSFGLILSGFAALLALDGAIATYLLGAPVLLLVCASLAAGIRRHVVTSRGMEGA